MSGIEYEERYSTSKHSKRYVIVSDTPRGGLWPIGWLLLLALVLFFLYGLLSIAPAIESDIERNVSKTLASAGYSNVTSHADGQSVAVTGSYLAKTDQNLEQVEREISALVKGTTCDALWAKDLVCPTVVSVDVDAQVPQTVPEISTRLHDFAMILSGAELLLGGEVPNDSIRKRILTRAKAEFPNTLVVDKLRISGDSQTESYEWALAKSWSVLSQLNAGEVAWKRGKFFARGEVDEVNAQRVRDAYASQDFNERLGAIDLQIIGEVSRCNRNFEQRLNNTSIQFKVASAAISPDSQNLLQDLADLAIECDMDLLVEGHTDDQGDFRMNQELSLSRAHAVADALGALGVTRNRLKPIGYGESNPLADNETVEGRALNRRIEIKVMQAKQN